MDVFKPYLYMGLKNHQEYQVCCAAIGLTGDICRGLKNKVLPYCDDIMTMLLSNLSVPTLHRTVKPQILSVFGDIALSIGTEFKKYLQVVCSFLMHASQLQVDRTDYDMVEYLNELRESILEAYTGIIQGLKGTEKKPNPEIALMLSQVPHIIKFISSLHEDPDVCDGNIGISAGLIGDMCTSFGPMFLEYVKEDIPMMLNAAKRSKEVRTKQLANYALKELKKLKDLSSW